MLDTPLRRIVTVAALVASLALIVWIRMGPAVEPSGLTDEERRVVAEAMSSGRVNPPATIAALEGRDGTLSGPSPARAPFELVGPRGTAVSSTRPTFAWSAGDADRYTIAIFDETVTEVARGVRVTGTTWTPAVDLKRGGVYHWRVTAHRASGDVTVPAPPQPEARFAVLDAVTAALVTGQRGRLTEEPLVLGILLARAGLLDEARVELTRARATPETAAAATLMMRSLGSR